MKKYRIYLFIILILMLTTFSVNGANYGGNLKVKLKQRPLNLNPIYAANKSEILITQQIFDCLISFDQNEEIVSNLAESWEINKEATVFSFKLKQDVYFQSYKINGKEIPKKKREVTAEDWKWSFEYLASPENKSPYADLLKKVKGYDQYRQGKTDGITGIRVLDKYHFEIELDETYVPFIYNLIKEAAVVLPREAVLNRAKKFSLSPVGTGPFKQGNFTYNQINLVKNNNYWRNNYREDKLPFLNQIQFVFDSQNNLKNNYKDFDLYQLNLEELRGLQQQKSYFRAYELKKLKCENYYYAGINFKSLINNDIKFNKIKAILHNNFKMNKYNDLNNINLIYSAANADHQTILDKIYYQSQEELLTSNSTENQEYDLTLTAAINNTEKSIKIAELLKEKLQTIGVDLNIKKYEWAEYLNRLENNRLESELFLMSYNYNNKFEFMADNFYSDSSKNYFNYKNSRLDNLIDYLKLEAEQKTRERAYNILAEILIEDHPYIVLFKDTDYYLISDKLADNSKFEYSYLDANFELLYFK